MIERKFNPDKCRWEAEFGFGGWQVWGNAYFPTGYNRKEFSAEAASILRPNSHLAVDWTEGICRLAAAAPEMLKVLEKIAGLQLEKLIGKDMEKEIRNAIKNAKGEQK